MTLRLFYGDAFLREFSATVLEARRVDGRPAVVLDRTAFYATSGGQPFDTGLLGGARVVEVGEDEAGAIVHMLDRPLEPGPTAGSVDWDRRFDHMQQHTGQHILSQAFVQAAKAPTISFHMGQETSTIDLELPAPTAELMEQVEQLATRIVFEDRPVSVLTVQPDELAALGVRKATERQGEVRVIDVEGFDRSPCGGTHVRRSGEIGMIAILGFERYKGGTRVEFVCGGRALRALRRDHELLKQLARLHSGAIEELPRLAEKILQERASVVRENARLAMELLDSEARGLVPAAAGSGPVVVRRSLGDRPLEALKLLAQKAIVHGADLVLLGSEAGQAVVARGPRLTGDCAAAVRHANGRHGGKGGGKPDMAQAGAIPPGGVDAWLESAEDHFALSEPGRRADRNTE